MSLTAVLPIEAAFLDAPRCDRFGTAFQDLPDRPRRLCPSGKCDADHADFWMSHTSRIGIYL